MSRVEVIVYLPDMLMHRMKALGVTSPAAIVETILSWLEDEHIANAALESRVMVRYAASTPVRVRVPTPLVNKVRQRGDPDLARFVEAVMSWVQDEHVFDAQRVLRDQLISQRSVVASAAGWIASEDLLDAPEVWEAMRGFSPQARRDASIILARVGKPAIPGLLALLDDGRLSTRLAAIRTLGLIGDPAVIDTVRRYLSDNDPILAAAASRALTAIGTPQALAWVDAWKRRRKKAT
ncbi:MAG: HEAT repeat domain-containing protein [bacterium]|nr:HEAT repeat domain-containing protein [bacterium]